MLFERQQYQEDCVHNIVTTLKDSEEVSDFSLLHESLRAVQTDKAIPIKYNSNHNRLDVLMETGTGKTFTYLKTMYALNKEYGTNKFVVFVPRTAIQEGIIQNIALTSDYFFREYGKRIKLQSYKNNGLVQIRNFVRDKNELSVLILTSSSINKPTNKTSKGNILRRQHENIGRENSTPLDAIAELTPVIFIDEPHLLKGEKFTEAYNEFFSKLLCIRFGATFPNEENHKISNVVYTLDSLSAFREYLVKRIRVFTLVNQESGIKFSNLQVREKRVTIFYFQENIEYSKGISFGEDIGGAINDNRYNGLHIVRAKNQKVYLSDHTEHSLKNRYEISDETVRQMIRQTIKIHFEKEQELFTQNLKALTLFFIPNVSDFRGNSPRIKTIFEQEYTEVRAEYMKKELSEEYCQYLEQDYDEEHNLCVHEGYFSGDRGSQETQEAKGVELILKEKNKLLSMQTPLRFIFSVWALQEGWDNPNIFTICKLAATDAETSRRQQVGRGLRLAVNQGGRRQTYNYCEQNENRFYDINTLDIVVSGQEKNFIESIQEEINEYSYRFSGNTITEEMLCKLNLNRKQLRKLFDFLEEHEIIEFVELANQYAVRSSIAEFLKNFKDQLPQVLLSKYDELMKFFIDAAKSPVIDAHKKPEKVSIRKAQAEAFKELWETITRKAEITYSDIDEENLKKCICARFASETIDSVEVILKTQTYNPQTDEVENVRQDKLSNQQFFVKATYADFVLAFAKEAKLPLTFTIDMFNQLGKSRDKIKNNPKRASQLLQKIVKEEIHKNIIHSIGYEFKSDITISNCPPLYSEDGTPNSEIASHHLGQYIDPKIAPPKHYLYNKIVFDSIIEKQVVQNDPEKVDQKIIKVFAKLPKISIPTPYKTYSPDFAYLIETANSKRIFLIVETKGYESESDIPLDQQTKIDYAKKFFKALQRHIQNIPNTRIEYKTRINKQELYQLLTEISQ